MEEKRDIEVEESKENSKEPQIAYTESILMYLHIIGFIIAVFALQEFIIPLGILFAFGIVAYEAKYVGLAYFISFGVPLLLLFGLFLMCTSSFKH